MRWVADSWIQNIESSYTQCHHISIEESVNIEIRDSYIHDSFDKGGGGTGYGISLQQYVTNSLIENNILSDLRHSLIVQLGVNGCVFGYNFCRRNYDNNGFDVAYISLHGNYPFVNLFEGNIVGYAHISDNWGPSGPGNTFFRNRIVGTNWNGDFGQNRGIHIDDYSHYQNIIGNELVGQKTNISFDGVYNTDPLKGLQEKFCLMAIISMARLNGIRPWIITFRNHFT